MQLRFSVFQYAQANLLYNIKPAQCAKSHCSPLLFIPFPFQQYSSKSSSSIDSSTFNTTVLWRMHTATYNLETKGSMERTVASGHQKIAIFFLDMQILQLGQRAGMSWTYDGNLAALSRSVLICHSSGWWCIWLLPVSFVCRWLTWLLFFVCFACLKCRQIFWVAKDRRTVPSRRKTAGWRWNNWVSEIRQVARCCFSTPAALIATVYYGVCSS